MSNELSMVVEEVGVLAEVHGEAVVVNEGFVCARRGAVGLVDGRFDGARGRGWGAGGSEAKMFCWGKAVDVDVWGVWNWVNMFRIGK